MSVSGLTIFIIILNMLIGVAIPVGLCFFCRKKWKCDFLPFWVGCGVMFLFAFGPLILWQTMSLMFVFSSNSIFIAYMHIFFIQEPSNDVLSCVFIVIWILLDPSPGQESRVLEGYRPQFLRFLALGNLLSLLRNIHTGRWFEKLSISPRSIRLSGMQKDLLGYVTLISSL